MHVGACHSSALLRSDLISLHCSHPQLVSARPAPCSSDLGDLLLPQGLARAVPSAWKLAPERPLAAYLASTKSPAHSGPSGHSIYNGISSNAP